MLSQIIVSVVAAICVALITNAYLSRDGDPAPGTLPALQSETIGDLPVKDLGTPEPEIFPGVAADSAIAAAAGQVQAANAERDERRRLGLPAPYTPPAERLSEAPATGAPSAE